MHKSSSNDPAHRRVDDPETRGEGWVSRLFTCDPEPFAQPVEDLDGRRHRRTGQGDDELLAPESAGDVRVPQRPFDNLRELAQRPIAGPVAVRVVQQLE